MGARPVARRLPKVQVLRRVAVLALVVGAVSVGLVSRWTTSTGARALAVPDSGSAGAEGLAAGASSDGVEGRLLVAGADDEAAWRALVALERVVALEAHRDVLVKDPTYAVFGALPEWVAPSSPRPLQDLGVAVSPLVSPQED